MAHAYYHAEQYDEAVAWAEKAAAIDPTYVGGLRILARELCPSRTNTRRTSCGAKNVRDRSDGRASQISATRLVHTFLKVSPDMKRA